MSVATGAAQSTTPENEPTMKRFITLSLLISACLSGGAAPAPVPDAGATSSPCASLCAAASCPANCAAMCEAGGAAVSQCQVQYNAVVRCAAASGQTCSFAQGGGPSCTAQGQAYADCVSGGGTTTDAGTTPADAGSAPVDAGDTPAASIAGIWEFSTETPAIEYRLEIIGGSGSSTVQYRTVSTLSGSGCVTTNEYEGSWALAGSSLTVRFDVGTTEVTRCTDSSRDVARMELPESNRTSVAADYSGAVTVGATELTFTMFRGSSTRTFTRAR